MSFDLWQLGRERLAAELPEQQFATWIHPLPPAEVSEDGEEGLVVTLRAPNRFKLDWLRSQYSRRIADMLGDLAGCPVRLELGLVGQPTRAAAVAAPAAARAALPHERPPTHHPTVLSAPPFLGPDAEPAADLGGL
ncbi:chromosomal replication initiator protein DnaA, partial [Ideonella sp. TBM-1]|nr:chromosomal replication initiator protein DnaA [Ideonella livida]